MCQQIQKPQKAIEQQEPHHRRRLPLEMESEIFKFLKWPIQLKLIASMGRGIYGLFHQRLIVKVKRLMNSKGNHWVSTESNVKISWDKLKVSTRCDWLGVPNRKWKYVFAKKGFVISEACSRKDNFPGTIVNYFEVTCSTSERGFYIGFFNGNIPPDPTWFCEGPEFYVFSHSQIYYNYDRCCLAGNYHYFERPNGPIKVKYDENGEITIGCGILLNPENKLSIFFTANGILLDNKSFVSVNVPVSYSGDHYWKTRWGRIGTSANGTFVKESQGSTIPDFYNTWLAIYQNSLTLISNEQVLDFVKLHCDYFTTQGRIRIDFSRHLNLLNDGRHKQALVDQLFTIFRNASKNDLKLLCPFENLMQNVKDMDNGMEAIHLTYFGESDIPMLMQMLATRRADGQQRVIQLQNFQNQNLAEKIVASIKREFRASTQPLPQPFLFRFYRSNFAFMPYEEENQQIDETLVTINSDPNGRYWDICRHSTGPHEEWAEDGRRRLKYGPNAHAPYKYISVNIFDFGQKAASDSFQRDGIEIGQKQPENVDLDNGIMNDADADDRDKEEGLMQEVAKGMVDKCQVDSASKIGKSKIVICMSVEVWVDVFGFIKRIQLARTVCLTCWHIYDICYPRLHGNKVVEHEIREIIIGRRDGEELGHPPTALLLKDRGEVPFPSCSPPSYITAFPYIQINIIDHRVLDFLKFTAPRIIQNRVGIMLDLMKPLEEVECLTVDQLLNIYRDISANIYLDVMCPVSSLHHILSYHLDNKMELIELHITKESDIQTVVEMLATPRPDGRQHVTYLNFENVVLFKQMLAIVKEEFLASTQPLPQPFYIRCWDITQNNLHIEEENHHREQTDEELTIRSITNRYGNRHWDICRHSAGKHEEWAEDGRKRLEWEEDKEKDCTLMVMDIFDFGETHFFIA